MARKDATHDLVPHVTFPIPSLKDIPKPGTLSEEARLQTIIANLDKQHQAARLSIIEAAKRERSTPIPHTHTRLASDPDPDRTDALDGSDDMDRVLAHLQEPYRKSQGDPQTTFPPPPGVLVRQVPPPPDVLRAKDTLDKIALYDAIALPTRHLYQDALSRRVGGPSLGTDRGTLGRADPDGLGLAGRTESGSWKANAHGTGPSPMQRTTDPRIRR